MRRYKSRIQDQHRRLGASCDWERERFTLDDGLTRAVREVFVRLYEEGLVYRGERIINWCPDCMSAISDLEVETENDARRRSTTSAIPWSHSLARRETRYITVATTRPRRSWAIPLSRSIRTTSATATSWAAMPSCRS